MVFYKVVQSIEVSHVRISLSTEDSKLLINWRKLKFKYSTIVDIYWSIKVTILLSTEDSNWYIEEKYKVTILL